MISDLAKQFLASSAAQDAVRQLMGLGIANDRATSAVRAATEGAMDHVKGAEGGLAGVVASVGRLFGGAGPGEVSPEVLDTIAESVAAKTGLSPTMSRMAVDLVAPRFTDFVKSQQGRSAA